MISHDRIDEHLKFLIREVEAQLERTEASLETGEPPAKMAEREDRINNLKVLIHRKAFAIAPAVVSDEGVSVDMLQAYAVVAANLESIADHCQSVIDQVRYVEEEDAIAEQDFTPLFRLVREAVGEIPAAVFDQDVDAALRICQAEDDLDQLYERGFHDLLEGLAELDKGESAQTHVTIIFILRYLERMGDSLLNIGEAVLGAALGEPIKISRLRALEESLESADGTDSLQNVSLHPLAETRSGCRISRVEGARQNEPVIFKQGDLRKLEAEKANAEAWQQVAPGLAPGVQAFQRSGQHGAILLDYLEGRTFEEVVLKGSSSEVTQALTRLVETLETVWRTTREDREVPGRFMDQLARRLPDVFAIHPKFDRGSQAVGDHTQAGLDELINRASAIERAHPAPFAVFGHGDFNVDNIIINAEAGQVHFIDLHRSRMLDYVQDVAVFLVSNHRLQVFDRPRRARIGYVMRAFHERARSHAEAAGDATFDLRLALGLARNWATSSRFVLVPWFARSLFLRASYLLERVVEAPDPAAFALPREVLGD